MKNSKTMLKIHELLLTFFYTGKSPKAPGTVGSFASLVFWLFFVCCFSNHKTSLLDQNIFWGIFLISAFIYGSTATKHYTKQFKQVDHQTIVLDEVIGQIFALQVTFSFLYENYFSNIWLVAIHLIFCFASFRFFDITKPSIIGYCDRRLKTGFGVMFDDLLCGIVTAIIGLLFLKLTLMIR
jgi:phosphatidylglycerophosphatase A